MKKRLLGIIVAGLLLTAGAVVPGMTTPASATSDETASHTLALPEGEQRYIVKYGDDANAQEESRSLEQKGIEVKETLSHAMKASVVVATPREIDALRESAGVASVEVDTPVSVSGATSIWGLDRIDQRSGRDGQFSLGDEGSGVNIYIVDTGLRVDHTEFSGRVAATWWNVHDGRGVGDCSGHGTHVAGSAAGTTYGVAKKANIIPVRVLDCDGFGWSSTVMAGIDWAIAHHAAGQPAVMNLSVGGFTNASFDQTVQSAVNDGITVVAAAGNDGVDACTASPARVGSAITVAATDINDNQVSWSNYGSCVDLQAPGLSIRSAWINAPTGYNTLSGTSMAAPHVSGAAAILLSRDRALSPAEVHQVTINNATVGVIGANKGATPNRMLYIPVPAAGRPACGNLKMGDGWAGVGTHCGLQGSAASTASVAEAAAGGIDTPVGALADRAEQTTQPAEVEVPVQKVDREPQETVADNRDETPATPAGASPEIGAVLPVPVADAPAAARQDRVETPAAQAIEARKLPAAEAPEEASGGETTPDGPMWLLTISAVLTGAALMYARSRAPGSPKPAK